MDNIRRRIVGVVFPRSIFEDRCVDFRRSMIDVSTFEDRCVALRRSMSRCVDLRRSMCRLSKNDVSTFGDGCFDLSWQFLSYPKIVLGQKFSAEN